MTNKKGKILCILVIFIFLGLLILSTFLSSKVKINYDISKYLDKDSDTSKALAITNDEFGKNTSLLVMAKNVGQEKANEINSTLASCDGVMFVLFDVGDENNYKDGNALYTLLIEGDDYSESTEQINLNVQKTLKEKYSDVSFVFGGGVEGYNKLKDSILYEMVLILVISIAIVIVIMFFTLKSWLEPFILLISCGFAIFLNRGSNIIFGEISYVINAISAILQLALSIDYSIVLMNKYRANKELTENKYAAMKKTIFEVLRPVSASAFTTIAGLLALLFMSFRIGFDIGIVLMKGIVVSLITAMTLLPSFILLFDKLLEKTSKRTVKLTGTIFSSVAFKSNKIIAIVAILIIIPCAFLSHLNVYNFSENDKNEIREVFGENQTVMVLYKNTDSASEKENEFEKRLGEYKDKDGINPLFRFVSYSNTIGKEYTYEEVSDEFGIEKGDAQLLFIAYHMSKGGGFSDSIVASDLLEYIYQGANDESSMIYSKITPETKEQVVSLHDNIDNYSSLLQSDNHTRMLLSLKIEKESERTSSYVEYLKKESNDIFGEGTFVAGEICTTYDMQESFKYDNVLISIFTIVSIFIIVMLIFRSLYFPVVLVAIVQGAIWIDLTTSLIDASGGLFFISYLMATCILMGSTIDYGILLSSEYVRNRELYDKKEALKLSINAALPTLFTSGLIMVVCGFVISIISTQRIISSVGLLIGKGTSFAIILVIIVLPSILYSTDKLLLKLTIRKKKKE